MDEELCVTRFDFTKLRYFNYVNALYYAIDCLPRLVRARVLMRILGRRAGRCRQCSVVVVSILIHVDSR